MRVTGRGYWLDEADPPAPPPAPQPPLDGDERADVVVVGGGYTGLWAAWHLLERAPGARIVLLESGVCGEGPSGRNGGFCDHLAHAAPRLRERFGDAAARATILASIESVHAIGRWCEREGVDAWFRPGGGIVASTAPAHDDASDEAIAACAALGLGEELHAIAAQRVRARCASPILRRGAFSPSTATLQPARLARGLRARLIERGVVIREGSRVTAIRETGTGVVAETAHGRVFAPAAILAAGPRSVALAPLRRRATVSSSHLVVTEPVPDVLERLGWTGGEAITDARHLVHYFRTTPDGRIAFGWGGGRIAYGARLQPRDDADRNLARQVAADLVRFFPMLAGRRVEHAWGGPIDASPTHLPFADTLPGGRVHFALGFTGNGVGPSELCGRILARMALDERDALTALPLVAPADRLLPPEPLRVLGGEVVRRALASKERAEEQGRAPAAAARAGAALPRLLGVQIGR